jgi:hypothetical protein
MPERLGKDAEPLADREVLGPRLRAGRQVSYRSPGPSAALPSASTWWPVRGTLSRWSRAVTDDPMLDKTASQPTYQPETISTG